MAIAFVNVTTGGSSSSSITTTTAATNHTTGNTLVLVFSWSGGDSAASITDTAGNTYVQCGTVQTLLGSSFDYWVATNITGNASNVLTITLNDSRTFRNWAVCQYSGMDLVSPYDARSAPALTSSTSTTHTAPAVTTTSANDLVTGFWVDWDGGYTLSSGASTTLRGQTGAGSNAAADRLATSAGSYAVQLTSASATRYAMLAAAFKEAGISFIPRQCLLGVG